ncbi:hypothetical protein CDV25_05290 [Helicobacter apodemus]|uniref:Uncharacterized protein n=1 Tax=Helicobacter apodemus TaxID=135569 RepID=A0A2U8FDA8_9HELI|nr:hypothetical protein CDV25_05290 [Helicobacter apodemus]
MHFATHRATFNRINLSQSFFALIPPYPLSNSPLNPPFNPIFSLIAFCIICFYRQAIKTQKLSLKYFGWRELERGFKGENSKGLG